MLLHRSFSSLTSCPKTFVFTSHQSSPSLSHQVQLFVSDFKASSLPVQGNILAPTLACLAVPASVTVLLSFTSNKSSCASHQIWETFPVSSIPAFRSSHKSLLFHKGCGKTVVWSGIYHCFSCLSVVVPLGPWPGQICPCALFCLEKWTFCVRKLLCCTKSVLRYSGSTNPGQHCLLLLVISENRKKPKPEIMCHCYSHLKLLASAVFQSSPCPLFILNRSILFQCRLSGFLEQVVHKECHFHCFVGGTVHIVKPKFRCFFGQSVCSSKGNQWKATGAAVPVFPSEKVAGTLQCV